MKRVNYQQFVKMFFWNDVLQRYSPLPELKSLEFANFCRIGDGVKMNIITCPFSSFRD